MVEPWDGVEDEEEDSGAEAGDMGEGCQIGCGKAAGSAE